MDTKKRIRKIIILICAVAALIIAVSEFREETYDIKAMYVTFGEEVSIFIDTEDNSAFYATFPDEIYDINGKKISQKDLRKGNIVKIYGDGIMLESYPAQYPGTTKMEVVEEGVPSDADKYQHIIDGIYREPDPSEPPSLNLEFDVPMAKAWAMTNRGAYNWRYEDKAGSVREDIADTAHVLMWKDINDLNLEADTDMKLSFSKEPDVVSGLRWKEEMRLTETEGSEPPEGEEIIAQEKDGQWYLEGVQPGYVYLIQAEWEDGRVEYGFMS